jgi:acylphosphatase
MSNLFAVRMIVHGFVQGVFFRAFTLRKARVLGVTGYVRNLRDSKAVEIHAEGKKTELEELIDNLKIGPPRAKVEKMDVIWLDYSGNYSNFSIKY